MKIAFFEIEGWEEESIKKQLPKGNDYFFSKDKLTKENVDQVKDFEIISTFINSLFTKEIFDKLPNLKLITTRSTGFDHVDLAECKKRNIIVSNVPYYGENTVAEHAFALLLSISRRIVECVDRTRAGTFSYEGLRGFDLAGKTFGIIGTGNIGKHACRMAHGFDMKILAYDVVQNKDLIKKYGIQYVDLDTLLSQSDIISVHVPLIPQTHHMINKKNYKKIKKGCVLINTARGGIVETDALFKAIDEGYLAGVGLDVIEEEAVLKDELEVLRKGQGVNWHQAFEGHALLHHPKVIVTPHNAFNTKEAIERILNTSIDNIKGFLEGKPQNNVVK
ncbi:MAG: hydroxyacid dehydrogenase [Candidatus Woesearchaeota archaeon]